MDLVKLNVRRQDTLVPVGYFAVDSSFWMRVWRGEMPFVQFAYPLNDESVRVLTLPVDMLFKDGLRFDVTVYAAPEQDEQLSKVRCFRRYAVSENRDEA